MRETFRKSTQIVKSEFGDRPLNSVAVQVVGAGLGVDGKRSRLPSAIVTGTDSPAGGACTGAAEEKPWKLAGKLTDTGDIFIDFTPKGGPKNLLGKWDKDGVVFPDGNKWSKIVPE